jgi:SAM-dependent methyltransferase
MNESLVTHRDNCRVCGSRSLNKLFDLGDMPLAGSFLSSEMSINDENFFPLSVYYCEDCTLVQVLDVINPDYLFKNYNYESSVIPSLNNHFIEYSKFIKKRFAEIENLKILEFGSNDGVFLKEFSSNDAFCLGVDPSLNVSKKAKEKGINIFNDYFNAESSRKIVEKYGHFDIVTGSNVLAHMDDVHTVVTAAKNVLRSSGVIIVEVHYLPDLINLNQYDTIYHEHLSYYTLRSLVELFRIHDMSVIDALKVDSHGGSIRVVASVDNKQKKSPNIKNILSEESGIDLEYFNNFAQNVESQSNEIVTILKELKKNGKKIIGYGAAGRGTIFLNYCGIGNDILDYIVDSSKLRIGKLMPGVHVPIKDICKLKEDEKKPDYILIIAWNYSDSIIEQARTLLNKNLKFIIPFPHVTIVSD